MLQVGDSASRTITITDDQIRTFAQASGDHNPIHLDEAYAASTPFGKRIAHGMLTASFISAVIGNELPGPGTIYMGQDLKFKAPVHIGDRVTVKVEVTKFRAERRIATLATTCTNQDGKVVLEGEAVVMAPEEQ